MDESSSLKIKATVLFDLERADRRVDRLSDAGKRHDLTFSLLLSDRSISIAPRPLR